MKININIHIQDLDVSANLLASLPASLASLKRIKRINLAHNGAPLLSHSSICVVNFGSLPLTNAGIKLL